VCERCATLELELEELREKVRGLQDGCRKLLEVYVTPTGVMDPEPPTDIGHG